MIDILSLGLGVQSTALYYKSAMGEIPRIDYAVFADTGREKSGTMRYLEFLLKWKDQNNGPEIIVKQDKNLFNDLINQRNSYGSYASIWKNFIYPFVGYAIPGKGKWYKLPDNLYHPNDRSSLITWYRLMGLPIPPKSSCVFCPYTDDAS